MIYLSNADEKKESQSRLRFNNQLRRSMEKQQSLSTITEEIKSTSTRSNKPRCNKPSELMANIELENLNAGTSLKSPPTLPCPLASHVKRHCSYVLKGTEVELLLPHEEKCPRTSIVKQEVYDHIKSNTKPLFHTVTPDSAEVPSILVTGFGLRNLTSLEDALKVQEQIRKKQAYKVDQEKFVEEEVIEQAQSYATIDSIVETKKSDSSETQTESLYSEDVDQQERLNYLMGLQTDNEENDSEEYELVEDIKKDQPQTSKSMRKAQKYMRIHRIFEIFQFITAHLLSALPDDPIEFIINLLDKCMIFRSGLSQPPLLYDRKHLECLFNLMDRMRTGFIDLNQYHTGMRTVGLETYNKDPSLSEDNMVDKQTFIEEGYDSLTELLTDLLRPRWLDGHKPKPLPRERTPQVSIVSDTSINANVPFTKTKLILR